MKLIDIWHGELRKLGIHEKYLEMGAEYADAHSPMGAVLIRQEVPEELEEAFQKMFAKLAEKLLGDMLREKQ